MTMESLEKMIGDIPYRALLPTRANKYTVQGSPAGSKKKTQLELVINQLAYH